MKKQCHFINHFNLDFTCIFPFNYDYYFWFYSIFSVMVYFLSHFTEVSWTASGQYGKYCKQRSLLLFTIICITGKIYMFGKQYRDLDPFHLICTLLTVKKELTSMGKHGLFPIIGYLDRHSILIFSRYVC